MARRKIKIKNRVNHNRKNRKPFRLAPYIIILTLCLSLSLGVLKFLKNSSYFDIKQIICSDIERQSELKRVLDLKEKNIFSLDLKAVSEKLQSEYPQAAQIVISRIFPDKLLIEFRERAPFAKFQLSNQDFVIDNEAVVLDCPRDYDRDRLTTLKGLNITFKDLKPGQKLRLKNVSLALDLLGLINRIPLLRQYKVQELDISNLNKISFIIHDEIVILTRKVDFNKKLNILVSLLRQLEPELEEISYIDLRFKDPVIKKK
ncbi:MAG: cell division protein FtsQ/DivIB [Candidatus Omnitrophota bacterium]